MYTFFAKLKLWEVLLMVAICLLVALVYETHNAPGRYVKTSAGILLDTVTGRYWVYDSSVDEWKVLRPAIPMIGKKVQ